MLSQVLGLGVDLPQHGEVEYPSLGVGHPQTMTSVVSNHSDIGIRLAEVTRITNEDSEGLYPPS